ncbi:protein of unknown function [Tenacibaculum sp. 190130A14a]|uniref:Serpin domain-containing protein n=1 Tax=Tenacibaculum polynesiense TaxID=3137857 RepID=A0ABP1ESN0_9FLAO
MQNYILSLLRILYDKEENPIISPYCLETGLTILNEGTVGKTKEEILRLIEREDDNLVRISQYYKELNKLNEKISFELTNEIVHAPELSLKKAYQERLENEIPLKVKKEEINDVSAVFSIKSYFNLEGFWVENFYELSTPEMFTLTSGESIDALYICQSNIYGENKTKYFKGETYQAIQIPLEGDNIQVEIYLPNKYNGLEAFLSSVNSDFFRTHKFEEVDAIKVLLPKFKTNSEFNLKDYKEELDIQRVFDVDFDFSNLFDDNELVYITKVQQENEFELNEKGIKGKSITTIGGVAGGLFQPQKYVHFEASHPFLYLVRDNATQDALFVGLMKHPYNEGIPLMLYNEREYLKFKENKSRISDVTSLLVTLYALWKWVELLRIENKFVDWFSSLLLDLIETPHDIDRKEKIEFIANLDLNDLDNIKLDEETRNSVDELLKKMYVVRHIITRLIEKYYAIDYIDDKGYVLECLRELKERNVQLPSFDILFKCEKEVSSVTINELKERIKLLQEHPLPEIVSTKEEINRKQQQKYIREILPITLEINVRGMVYFGLMSLEKIIEKYQYTIDELLLWRKEIRTLISSELENEKLIERIGKLQIGGLDEQTGCYASSEFITEEVHKNIIEEYIEVGKILELVSSLFFAIEILNNTSSLLVDIGYYFECIFKELVSHDIDLSFFENFKKYKITKGDVIGDPIKIS